TFPRTRGKEQGGGRSQVTQPCSLIAPSFRPAAAQRAFAGDAAVLTDCAKLPARCSAAGVRRHARQCRANRAYSPNVSRLALPPAAVVLMVMVFSVAKRGREWGPPALGPVPERFWPPKGWTPTTAPIWLRLT